VADLNFEGILLGAAAFLIIGLLHPVVIKAEYHFGTKVRPIFLAAGLGCLSASLLTAGTLLSGILGMAGFSLLWTIRELFEQKERVKKGWFPGNPKRGTGREGKTKPGKTTADKP
jgi:hypothetical protein